MARTWITECLARTGPCRDRTVEVCDHASNSNNGSEACETEEYDSDYEDEANTTSSQGSTRMGWIREHTNGTFVPTRLLDLFPVSAHAPGCISLVERTHLEEDVRYAALSYCWGDVKPTVLTTRANLESQKQGIELSALPQCLRDAVTVGRGLEIQYLWIDALCIIQDDSDDWARESATMWQLFQNAYVTIAAVASESFDEGLFTHGPFEVLDLDFSSVLDPQVVGKIALSTIASKRRSVWTDQLEADLGHCKWDTRGWVWQEQKSSKRLLIFGERMIHFKCEHGARSEDGSTGCRVEPLAEYGRGSWTTRLKDYTLKSFTFPQDKLPGISGLSKQMNQNSIIRGAGSAEYLAGIWYCSSSDWRWPPDSDCLEWEHRDKSWQDQLVWGAITPCRSFNQMLEQYKRNDSRTYTAPSWSWASCGGGVGWHIHHIQFGHYDPRRCPPLFEAKMEDHHMNLTGPDPNGRVGPGSYLKLSGVMHRDPLDLSILKKHSHIGDNIFHWYECETSRFVYVDLSFDWKHSTTDQEHKLYEGEIRFFGLQGFRPTTTEDNKHFHGLLLFQDRVSGFYFRVGVFSGRPYRTWSSLMSYEQQIQWLHTEGWETQSVYIL